MIEPGALLDGRYRLEERIGAGGAGEVWRARHVTLNSIVAIKVLHVGASHKELAKKRFLQEARVTAQLRIRQAVQVHDFGFAGERPYLVMELLDGETLKARLAKKGRLSVRETTVILRQAARALERAHALGIIHRDFKPDNVFVLQDEDGDEDVRVVDFGIAKLVGGFDEVEEEPHNDLEAASDRNVLLNFTRTGGVLGTPYYMAPEQVQSNPRLGPEVDLWAFGVVAYECLTGRRPFDGESAGLLFKAILEADHIAADRICPDLPSSFATWFRTACAPDPEKRFSDARTAVATLEEALGVLPIVGPSWLEATDPSIALRDVRRPSSSDDDTVRVSISTSLSGTAAAVHKHRTSRRRAVVALGAVLVSAAVGVGILAGYQGPEDIAGGSATASEAVRPADVASATTGVASASTDIAEPAVEPAVSASAGVPETVDTSTKEPPPVEPPATVRREPSGPRPKSPPAKSTTAVEPKVADPPPVAPPVTAPTATKTKPPSPLDLPPLGL